MDANRFDTLTRSLMDARSRRGALATLLGGTLALLGLVEMAAKNGKNGNGGGKKGKGGGKNGNGGGKKGNGNGKNKGNGKGNGNGNNKEKGNDSGSGNGRPARCGQEICAREFVGDQVVACEEKCGRCNVDGQFCVIEGYPNDPTKVATCCYRDQQCCQGTFACCDRTATCCGGYPEIYPQSCCPEGTSCCASAENGCCADGETCCPGVGCKNLSYDRNHCNACGNPCPDGLFCSEGACRCYVNAGTCPPGHVCNNNTGQCVPQPPDCVDANCPRGQRCNVSRNDGLCSCGDGFKYCTTSQRCIREEWWCCGGPQSVTGYCFREEDCCGSGVDAYCKASTTPQCP